jgi:hypothetical protein
MYYVVGSGAQVSGKGRPDWRIFPCECRFVLGDRIKARKRMKAGDASEVAQSVKGAAVSSETSLKANARRAQQRCES